MADLRDNWLALAAAVVRATDDPAELEKWRQWARDRRPGPIDHTGPPTAAQQARRPGHMIHFIDERRGKRG